MYLVGLHIYYSLIVVHIGLILIDILHEAEIKATLHDKTYHCADFYVYDHTKFHNFYLNRYNTLH